MTIQLREKQGSLIFNRDRSFDWRDADVRQINTFKIRYVDHQLSTWINDQPVLEDVRFSGVDIAPYRIGFFGTSKDEGPVIRFSDIRIRKVLDQVDRQPEKSEKSERIEGMEF